MNKFSEKDWKIFRSKIAGWQEAYMDSIIQSTELFNQFSTDFW